MSVVRTIKVVVVLLALVAGLPTMAFAHAENQHGQPDAESPSGSYPVMTAAEPMVQNTKNPSDVDHKMSGHSFEAPSSGQSAVLCTPGSCCCQGASSCGSGHCCSFGIASGISYGLVAHNDQSYRLALLGAPYPDLIFGRDRPPKV